MLMNNENLDILHLENLDTLHLKNLHIEHLDFRVSSYLR